MLLLSQYPTHCYGCDWPRMNKNNNACKYQCRRCYLRPYRLLRVPIIKAVTMLTKLAAPPTATLCLPSQLFGASLRLCKMTVLLCRRLVMSYHADVISWFSRRKFSTSCWSSIWACVSRVLCAWKREVVEFTEPFSAVSFLAASSCTRKVLLVESCSCKSYSHVSKKDRENIEKRRGSGREQGHKKQGRKISILQGSTARDKLARHSADVKVEKYSEPHGVDSFPLFGDSICVIRPQVPVPAVEEDISESDLSLPA
jgi:hypothetical protein